MTQGMELLRRAMTAMGLAARPEQLEAFERYRQLLVEWNRRFNLTAVTDHEQVQVRHFADSLTCLLATPQLLAAAQAGAPCSLVDVGSGAGFPGVPLKLIWPQARLVLVESVAKKGDFLRALTAELGLTETEVVVARSEAVGRDPAHRERYDLAVARAVADLSVLAEYCLPLVRRQGLVVAQKADDVAEEVVRAEHAITVLGGRVEQVLPVEVLGTALPRNLVVLRKESLTPETYPRRPGVPQKRPLRSTSRD